MPRDEGDLAIAARGSHVIALDNASGVQPWLSDALCRVSTGGGLSKRALYSDDDEVILDAKRPIILNGIDDVASRADLADRCLVLALPTIPKRKRLRECDLFAKFEEAAPRIFGALLDGLVSAVAREGEIKLDELPRMADFAMWATAAERGLGWPDGAFLKAYEANRLEAAQLTIDADPVAGAVVELLRRRPEGWRGTATDLLAELSSFVPDDLKRTQSWPKQPNRLSGMLRRAAPSLRAMNVIVQPTHIGTQRVVSVRRLEDSSSVSSRRTDTPFPTSDNDPNGVSRSATAMDEAELVERFS
jgi:hypothetical protein